MDDHRLIELTADTNVVAERALLLGFSFRGIKIIQTGLPHRHDALFRCQRAQSLYLPGLVLV